MSYCFYGFFEGRFKRPSKIKEDEVEAVYNYILANASIQLHPRKCKRKRYIEAICLLHSVFF